MKVRYYYWKKTSAYEWVQYGSCNGYSTIKECIKDNFIKPHEHNYKILKAVPIIQVRDRED